MIHSFKCKETERIFYSLRSTKFPGDIQSKALKKLNLVAAASTLEALRVPPGNRLKLLKGDRQGQYSIRINDQWRICFYWEDGLASEVEITDYH